MTNRMTEGLGSLSRLAARGQLQFVSPLTPAFCPLREKEKSAQLFGRGFLHHSLDFDGDRDEFFDEFTFAGFVNADLPVEAARGEPVGLWMKGHGENGSFMALQRRRALAIFP